MGREKAVGQRRLPIGAEVQNDGGVHFRLWAPHRQSVEIVFEDRLETAAFSQGNQVSADSGVPGKTEGSALKSRALSREENGYFSVFVPEAKKGTRYRFRLDQGRKLFPDPASRYQPEGPAGPSEVVSPDDYRWGDQHWQGLELPGQVIYELHIGTFTPEGTWLAAIRHFAYLKQTGITVIEVMPVAEFGGGFGWGYDGVDLFAPTHLYGTPDDFRYFIDQAHAMGLGVILDVVYNHIGPAHNYLEEYAPEYFTDRYANEWGKAINFDGPEAGPVREFFIANAGYWIAEYRLDGLRLDATQTIHDSSQPHILFEIGEQARSAAAGRAVIVVAENEKQHPILLSPPAEGGYGLDAAWNDDFHHSARVAATGRRDAYYIDYCGTPQELISAIRYGYLYQGQHFVWQGKRRGGLNLHIGPERFVIYLENHDQISNSAFGQRLCELTSPGRLRALTVLLLLAPGTPLLFQGQEYAASTPFVFFADHEPELARQVARGRGEFLRQFNSIALAAPPVPLPDPSDPATFARCKLRLAEANEGYHARILALHRDLLALRREDPAFRAQRPDGVAGAVLGPEAFVLRFFSPSKEAEQDRLLIVNLGKWLHSPSLAEPLLAPPPGCAWQILLSTESPVYGGTGSVPPEQDNSWSLQSHTATVMVPV